MKTFLYISAMTLMCQGLGAAIPIRLDLSQSNQVDVKTMADGGYAITTTGGDPWVMSQPLTASYDPNQQYVLSFDYFCAAGLDSFELFFGPPIRAGQSAEGPAVLSSEGWTSYSLNIKTGRKPGSWRGGYKLFRLDFGRTADRTIQIRDIQLRAPTGDERDAVLNAAGKTESLTAFDAALQALVNADFDSRITRVEATDDTIEITVKANKPGENLILCEIPFYQSPIGRTEFVWQKPLASLGGKRPIELPRIRGHHDRVFSSWVLMRQTPEGPVPASHQRFVEHIPAKWSLTRDRPLNKKGTVGLHGGNVFQFEDYKALGIHNATKNILLPSLVRAEPGDDTLPHSFNGTTVYIQQKALKRLDQAMLEMNELNIVVSAIILIPKNTPMSHPDCAPQGIYAMPNVVEEKGWNIYAAGLDFLARRYLRPDRKYGRITHWIMHNEVDAGWVWTNAGDIPLNTYLDLYDRSMRTAQSVIRRYGDAGDVLISLTHYWTTRHNSKCYAPKNMIDLLATRCSLEGNFDWGLACHPYPQNLRDPRTWRDEKVTGDFNTPLITPKNLDVLDAYMRQKQMLYDGKVRTIVLSEQGLNSPKQDVTSYRDQAAGLVYTWLKLEKLDSIESFIHHRWMDHPKEGGLNLGLRRRPETSNADAKKATATLCSEFAKFGIVCSPDETQKPAWDIYRVLETPDQKKAVDWAKSVIPNQYFKNSPAAVNQ